jgi:hypothetical protein
MAYFADESFSQVVGNSVTRGMRLGQHASRGSSLMSRFNRYSTGSEQITQPIKRTSRGPLSVRTQVFLQSPISGTGGVGRGRPRTRPTNTGILRPTRPTVFNRLLSSSPTMLSVGNVPKGRIFKVERNIGPLRPLRGYSTPFTIKPQELLRPDLQQQKSGIGLLLSRSSMAQQHTVTQQTTLTRNLLPAQEMLLTRNPSIFDISRQIQNQKQAPMSIFNVR